jgi:hypothetical protein
MPQLSIITIKFTRNAFRVFGVQFSGCKSVAVYLVARCRMSLQFVFVLMNRPVVKTSSTLQKFDDGCGLSVAFDILVAL